ncbi:unnamed protein product [Phytophthora fragariaefolia]|uniref:Unnamed protein product n=1 Tax=Phytophthora fragariaefolia TaxID=1490495 RepID=A0A9W6XKH6_9STRA|nr:unnamed protein product [Phytophthora fragariaefolia]
MGRKKSPRYTEDESPNLRPRPAPRPDDDNSEMNSQNANPSSQTELAAGVDQSPPSQSSQPAGPASMPAAAPSTTDHILSELVRMMAVQQAAIQASNLQMQTFMAQLAQFQSAMYEQQLRANGQKQKANPPRFYGRQDEDLELWLFHIEAHFAVYADLREGNDSRFVDMVVPVLGTDVMSWYREFKTSLGVTPRTWQLFK